MSVDPSSQIRRNALHLKTTPSSKRWSLGVQIMLMASLHFATLLCISGLIFLTSHIPPKAVNLDGLINLLVALENVLVCPRKFILWAWPWEHTPAWLGPVLTCFNSLVWGLALTGTRRCWQKLRR